jgi:hypothetical protein
VSEGRFQPLVHVTTGKHGSPLRDSSDCAELVRRESTTLIQSSVAHDLQRDPQPVAVHDKLSLRWIRRQGLRVCKLDGAGDSYERDHVVTITSPAAQSLEPISRFRSTTTPLLVGGWRRIRGSRGGAATVWTDWLCARWSRSARTARPASRTWLALPPACATVAVGDALSVGGGAHVAAAVVSAVRALGGAISVRPDGR